jgi:hypothetical protein
MPRIADPFDRTVVYGARETELFSQQLLTA